VYFNELASAQNIGHRIVPPGDAKELFIGCGHNYHHFVSSIDVGIVVRPSEIFDPQA